MSQTRTKPGKKKPAAPTPPVNGQVPPSVEVFTLSDAAAYLRVTEAELLRLVHDQALPGRRAQRHPPDMFCVNEFAERIHQINPGTFNELFG